MTELEKALNYSFKNKEHLRLALTHPSTNLPDNQRLEFLGDAILEFCVSDMLYKKYPEMHEGYLTSRRAALVCEKTLNVIGRSMNLGQYLIMGKGEEQTGGREKPSIIADTVEAVLAAVYIDGGYQAVRELILQLFQAEEKLISINRIDDKGALQQFTQARGMELPHYEIISEEGPDHNRQFTAQVTVLNEPVAVGRGNSKKAAEQAAARSALKKLNDRSASKEQPDATDKT